MDRPTVGRETGVIQYVMHSLRQRRWLHLGSFIMVVSACAEQSPIAPSMGTGGQQGITNGFVQGVYVERVIPLRLDGQLIVDLEFRVEEKRRLDVDSSLDRPGKPVSSKGRRRNLEQKRKYCERLPRDHGKFAACQTWLRNSSGGEQTRRKARVRQKRKYCAGLTPTDKGYQRCQSWLNSLPMREKRTRK